MRVIFRLLGVLFILGLLEVSTPIISSVQALPVSDKPTRDVTDTMLSGDQQVVVILVDSPNCPRKKSKEYYHTLFFGKSQSVTNYYKEVSYGKFRLSGIVLDWITISDTITARPARSEEAIKLADQNFDFKSYDRNGDNEVDYLIIVDTIGCDEEGFTSHVTFFSHLPDYNPVPVDGVNVDWHANIYANHPTSTFAHEFGHLLGLPDLYYPACTGDVGEWGLMGDDSHLVHLCAYSKLQLGWITPLSLEQEGDVIIKAAKN